jgi:hypothetical protein
MKRKLQSRKCSCLEKANDKKEQAKKKTHVEKGDRRRVVLASPISNPSRSIQLKTVWEPSRTSAVGRPLSKWPCNGTPTLANSSRCHNCKELLGNKLAGRIPDRQLRPRRLRSLSNRLQGNAVSESFSEEEESLALGFFHEATGKIVKTRQDIFKTPPHPQSRFHRTPGIMPAAAPSTVISFPPVVTNNRKGKSKEAAIDLVESKEDDIDENDIIHEPKNSLVYGIQPDYQYSDSDNEDSRCDSSATVME